MAEGGEWMDISGDGGLLKKVCLMAGSIDRIECPDCPDCRFAASWNNWGKGAKGKGFQNHHHGMPCMVEWPDTNIDRTNQSINATNNRS